GPPNRLCACASFPKTPRGLCPSKPALPHLRIGECDIVKIACREKLLRRLAGEYSRHKEDEMDFHGIPSQGEALTAQAHGQAPAHTDRIPFWQRALSR